MTETTQHSDIENTSEIVNPEENGILRAFRLKPWLDDYINNYAKGHKLSKTMALHEIVKSVDELQQIRQTQAQAISAAQRQIQALEATVYSLKSQLAIIETRSPGPAATVKGTPIVRCLKLDLYTNPLDGKKPSPFLYKAQCDEFQNDPEVRKDRCLLSCMNLRPENREGVPEK